MPAVHTLVLRTGTSSDKIRFWPPAAEVASEVIADLVPEAFRFGDRGNDTVHEEFRIAAGSLETASSVGEQGRDPR
jgi:hypothetical protein